MFIVPGDNAVIEEVGGHQGVLAVVELDQGHLGVGVNEGLLVDTADALERAHVVCILGAQVAGVQALNLAV